MSSLKKLASKPTKKSSVKPAAAPGQAQKPFKSAELVQDSDEEAEIGDVAPTERQSASRHSEGISSTLTERTGLLSSKPPSPKPTTATKRINPGSSASGIKSSSGGSHNRKEEGAQRLQANDSEKAHGKERGKRARTAAKSSLRRKSASAGDTESSDGESEGRRNFSPRRRKVFSPSDSAAKRSSDKHTAPALKSLRQHTSSNSDIEEGKGNQSGDHKSTASRSSEENTTGIESQGESGEESTPAPPKKSDAISKQKATSPLIPYTPPSGFEPATKLSHASSAQTELFSQSNLQKKQIWHITAPISVPVSAITEVAKQSVKDGSSVLSYEGAAYGLVAEAEDENGNSMLLLPSDGDNRYSPASTGISVVLHLQQLIDLPSISHDIGAEDAGTQVGGTVSLSKPVEKLVPEQPVGLRIRYKPFGVLDSEDSDSGRRPHKPRKAPAFHITTLTGSSQATKKRKRDKANGNDSVELTNPSKLPKLAAAAEPLSTISSSSPVRQTPQKSKTVRDPKSRNEDEFESIAASMRSTPSEQATSVAESPAKARPGARQKDRYPKSSQMSKVSSPAKGSTKTKQSHHGEHSVLQTSFSNQDLSANGTHGEVSTRNIEKSAETPVEWQSSNPKKKRRKHKTTTEQDSTIQADNITVGESSPQAKVSTADKQLAKSNHDSEPSVIESPVKPKKQSAKRPTEHLAVPNGTAQSTEEDLTKRALGPAAKNIRHSPAKQSPMKRSEEGEESSSQPAVITKGQVESEPKKKLNHEGETMEERKKRRDEKKRRKEARSKAAQKA